MEHRSLPRAALTAAACIAAYLSTSWIQTALFLFLDGKPHLSNSPWLTVLRLFSAAATIGVVLLFGRVLEKRTFTSMGFVRSRALPDYGLGFLAGNVLFAAAALICLLCGAVRIERAASASPWWMAAYLTGFMVQGLSEEVLCRGYFLTALRQRMSSSAAVLFSALVFAVLHLGNTGLTVIGFLNVFLFGVFAGMVFLRCGSVWCIAALHTAWNFVQGNVFGVQVSGNDVTVSLLSTTPQGDAWYLHGGAFGLEGGVAVTATLLIATAIVAWRSRKLLGHTATQ